MYNEICRIERIANGFEVSFYEMPPKPKKGKKGEPQAIVGMESMWKTYFGKDISAVCAMIEQKLPTIKRGDEDEEFDSAFEEAQEDGS